MNWFRNCRTMTKLLLGFSALAVLVAGTGYIATSSMQTMNGRSEELYEKHLKGMHAIDETSTSVAMGGRGVRMTILSKTPEERKKNADQARQYLRDVQSHVDAAEQLLVTPDEKQKMADVKALAPAWIERLGSANSLAEAGRDKESLEVLQASAGGANQLVTAMAQLRETKFKTSKQAFESGTETYRSARQTMIGAVIGGVAGALLLGYLIAQLITAPLNRCVAVLEGVAKGDLTQRAEIDTRDETGRLAAALNVAIGNMQADVTEMARTKSMLDSAPINVMFADREFKIRYANAATFKSLRGVEHLLPIKADQLLGQSIDIFHKRPEHQRRLLGDPKNLPHSANIPLGTETLELNVNPVFDEKRNYIGAMVTWSIITERLALEKRVKENAERDAAQSAELQHKVSAITESVSALAAGDFTQQIPDLGTDEVGQMAAALNEAVVSVRTALEGVREVSVQLADASSQLSSASEEISTGAQEQASSLEETASTLEEITATVRQNSDSAQQARQLASTSRDTAEKGGQVVGNAVGAMSEINESSKKIADIITTIDEIAFQTNLLALNAAVEAARAGEQGRGFAVVASEVRNLAQRSATAAKEIKSLIEDSVKKVDAGTELVNRSGSTLGDIVTSVKRVTDIITEIAAASKEQSTGIDQVNKAVTQMDSVTQRNASQTEEMSATAQTLTDQAGQLRDLVSRFKLSDDGRPGARTAPKPVRAKAAPKPRPAVARAMSNGHSNGNGRAHDLDRLGGGGNDGFTEF
ncbi:Methyl-accepting chemotaxis protein II [Gemmata sp. SH-PL17]|uniref:methyl-accepting chemotaxis protein n=1 Tax=Gemmata sp. SH-PL17 TaxID=1630693 RepID=UPI00078E6729|nr:methyl-accepting chemotaxis protein [Gemmata sp. SH-PL17]AMV28041.1 Methyl-accepting chemotaxis protein II [Gemmata sp. SH-PL17]